MQPAVATPVRFQPSTYPIRETSMLGERGQELCSGIATFWAWPSFDSDTEGVNTSPMTVSLSVSTSSRKRHLLTVCGTNGAGRFSVRLCR